MSIFDRITAAAEASIQADAQVAREAAWAPVVAAQTNHFAERSALTAPSAGFVLPVAPATIQLYGYQAAAVETLLTYRRGIVGFAPGMGKTIVAQAAVAAEVQAGGRVLVVCPPSLRVDPWEREFGKQFPGLSVAVVTGTKSTPIPSADVIIVGDSVIAQRQADILAWGPTAMVIDETQRLKSPKAARSKAALAIADALGSNAMIIGLSGTLALGRTDEVWHPLRVVGAAQAAAVSGSPSFTAFRNRWCLTESVWTGRIMVEQVVGCSDPVGLHNALRAAAYIRVEREDVLDMPAKIWAVRSLALNGALTTYRRIEKDFINWLRAESGDAAARRASRAEAIVKLGQLWRQAGVAKAAAAAEYVTALTDQGEQVVVMGHHTDALAAFKAALPTETTTVEIIGGMSSTEKADASDRFRSGKAQVLIGNITSAGTGLNLDTAVHLVFIQLPWTPGDLVQASDRIYRVTQKRDCTIHVLSALGTVDDRLWGVLQAKAAVVDAINAGTEVTMPEGSVYEAIIEGYL